MKILMIIFTLILIHGVQKRDGKQLLPSSVYDTINAGKIAVIPNFLSRDYISTLRNDAQDLHATNYFSTDALASYGSDGKFDPARDRAVLKLARWKDPSLGDWILRSNFAKTMAAVRTDLALNLGRPCLDKGAAISKYGAGSTEISYTRFGSGAFLKRHIDEHHEEIKGPDGWMKPTRRSISWLIYLNDDTWDPSKNGGQLRCFERKESINKGLKVGSRRGDLQIGWLRRTPTDMERPVFLDGRIGGSGGKCAMYVDVDSRAGGVQYITSDFNSRPLLYMEGGEFVAQKALINRPDYASRFHFLERPKSLLSSVLGGKNNDITSSPAESDEVSMEVDPIGGTLVLFDSVSLPHEVLAPLWKTRWATSGWFHEDQQEVPTHLYHYGT